MDYTQSLQQKDLNHIWHPCSQMKDYETFPPIIIKSGQGVFLEDLEGNKYLDAVSSWWVNLFGHSNQRINEALYNQVKKLEHVIFANFSHEPAIELSERIIKLVPSGLSKVFFSDNGSSAVEIALKISFQYHQQIGKNKKTKFVALTDAYHGETLGALSVGGVDLYNKIYKPLLLDTIRVKGPDCYICEFEKKRETCNAECFKYMEEAILENHEDITGIIIEPMIQCAAGMKIYSKEYLKKLRLICDKYDINLIADEIAVGFGRTGKMFACEHANITPDIMCLSKGLTAGYMPMALTITNDKIYNAFYDDYNTFKAFLHSHSYTGNPLGCSVALETLNIFEEENILEKNKEKSQLINKKVKEIIKDIPYIGEYRQLGMVGAIELVEDKKTKSSLDLKKRAGYEIYKIALRKGVIIRPLGNVIYFMPPYIINEDEIDMMIKVAIDSIEEYFNINKNTTKS
ncbi:adenosylmethionine-8-amino-7-oxononanoate aminotransferase BioA [Gottschalkia acidurici 9a]|uniref:Adenosylmethionine-8-amino-7-oxononanoate aminotransferase n=1 Tax=Gottschalkia acidurici (strain ATCC 7906 / DSM 604 / BCRC 14475 / CIP 104303 / KCTC 5404 / NCIMB 10678 / 9a) TaxID=1128398 RepID=K0B4P9_GOTA9|nr:adenosylmethionine--8-amino-7-oxononanoate transaminase [Gottschalkia acidurici]AFS79546.1 adenosylmethionine-8-amino-7-oxononanoate aminotransferase BioA [Gottschalkia acidurici 9a]